MQDLFFPSFFFFFFFFTLWLCHAACGILVTWPGTEPRPLNWEHRVLATGPPGMTFFLVSIL